VVRNPSAGSALLRFHHAHRIAPHHLPATLGYAHADVGVRRSTTSSSRRRRHRAGHFRLGFLVGILLWLAYAWFLFQCAGLIVAGLNLAGVRR